MSLSNYSNSDLLIELLDRNGIASAPPVTTRFEPAVESLISIDADHTAVLTIFDSDLNCLLEISNGA